MMPGGLLAALLLMLQLTSATRHPPPPYVRLIIKRRASPPRARQPPQPKPAVPTTVNVRELRTRFPDGNTVYSRLSTPHRGATPGSGTPALGQSPMPTVVLLNGLNTTLDYWQSLEALLHAAGHPTLVYDRAGVGRSYDPASYDESSVRSNDAVLDELNLVLRAHGITAGGVNGVGVAANAASPTTTTVNAGHGLHSATTPSSGGRRLLAGRVQKRVLTSSLDASSPSGSGSSATGVQANPAGGGGGGGGGGGSGSIVLVAHSLAELYGRAAARRRLTAVDGGGWRLAGLVLVDGSMAEGLVEQEAVLRAYLEANAPGTPLESFLELLGRQDGLAGGSLGEFVSSFANAQEVVAQPLGAVPLYVIAANEGQDPGAAAAKDAVMRGWLALSTAPYGASCFVSLPDVGHMVPLERPQAIAAGVAFVAAAAAAGGGPQSGQMMCPGQLGPA